MSDHRLKWADVFSGRAEVRVDGPAISRLAHLAGAPWNDFDPDAELSRMQKEVIEAPERVLVLFGGSRGGKSIAGAAIALAQIVIPNSKIALIGHNYDHCAKEFGYLWRGFFKLFPRSAATSAHFLARRPHFSMSITTAWGSVVQVYSTTAKEGAQILGEEFDLAILCEAAQVESEIFYTKIERALMGRAKLRAKEDYLRRTGRAILLTTPRQQGGASYEVYQRALARTKGDLSKLLLENGAGWFESLRFWQADVRELNPSYPEEAFEAARKTLPKHAFEEQFLGRAVIRSGLVYSSFKEATHVIKRSQFPDLETLRKSRWGVGIDTGNNFAAVMGCLTPDTKAYLLGETYEIGQNTQENASCVLKMVDRVLEGVFSDAREAVDLWVVDVNSQHQMDLEQFLEVSLYAQKYDVLDSLGNLDMRMGRGEIFIAEELEFLLNELRGYRYRNRRPMHGVGPKKDVPTGEDHALDAMRYLLMQMFDAGPRPAPTVEWSVDEIMERERNAMLAPNLQRDLQELTRRQWQSVVGGNW